MLEPSCLIVQICPNSHKIGTFKTTCRAYFEVNAQYSDEEGQSRLHGGTSLRALLEFIIQILPSSEYEFWKEIL